MYMYKSESVGVFWLNPCDGLPTAEHEYKYLALLILAT